MSTAAVESRPTNRMQAPTRIATVRSVRLTMSPAFSALERARARDGAETDFSCCIGPFASLDVVVNVHVRAVAVQADRQLVRGAETGVGLEGLLRAAHLEAVDRLETIAVLHP